MGSSSFWSYRHACCETKADGLNLVFTRETIYAAPSIVLSNSSTNHSRWWLNAGAARPRRSWSTPSVSKRSCEIAAEAWPYLQDLPVFDRSTALPYERRSSVDARGWTNPECATYF